jgi:integrase
MAEPRFRGEDGKQRYKSLGFVTKEFGWTSAKAAAETWFEAQDAGISDEATVEAGCKEYVADLTNDGRLKAAHDAEKRFERYVYGTSFGKMLLSKLRTSHIKQWRVDVGGSKANQNRYLTSLRAALNYGVLHRRVAASAAIEWKAVKNHKDADGCRETFLDLKQRRALVDAATGNARDLIEAAALTGARPGELISIKVRDFDERTCTATFKGKTGTRTIPISDAAGALFKRASRSKLPAALMFAKDDGTPWIGWDWAEAVREAAARAGSPAGVVLYTLRHSWITEALRSGMATLDVARLTGTSLQMSQDHYGHLVADSARERLAQVVMV